MTFGERIAKFRKERGMTQEQLAKMIGVAKSTLTGYEKNNREPNIFTITKLTEVLNVSGNELLGIDTFKNEIDLELLRIYSNLPEAHRQILKNFAIYLTKASEISNEISITQIANKKFEVLKEAKDDSYTLKAASEIKGATQEEKAKAEAMMEDENEWK